MVTATSSVEVLRPVSRTSFKALPLIHEDQSIGVIIETVVRTGSPVDARTTGMEAVPSASFVDGFRHGSTGNYAACNDCRGRFGYHGANIAMRGTCARGRTRRRDAPQTTALWLYRSDVREAGPSRTEVPPQRPRMRAAVAVAVAVAREPSSKREARSRMLQGSGHPWATTFRTDFVERQPSM